jgi:hypothetical protein
MWAVILCVAPSQTAGETLHAISGVIWDGPRSEFLLSPEYSQVGKYFITMPVSCPCKRFSFLVSKFDGILRLSSVSLSRARHKACAGVGLFN